MKSLIFICGVWVISFLSIFSAELPNLQTGFSTELTQQIAYRIYIPPGSSMHYKTARVIDIVKVPKEHLIPNAIHIKTKNLIGFDKNFRQIHSSSISTVLNKYEIRNIRAPFLESQAVSPLSNNSEGIEKLIEVYFSDEIDPYEICKELMQSPDVEYAVPIYKRYLYDFVPNDPYISSQWFINNIQLPKAWDVTKGDKKILIAIIDSGVDWNHQDLIDNIWVNPNEIPNNGTDDDRNGKVDDIRGWDFVGNVTSQDIFAGNWREDNDPTNIKGFHGTHVAGLASAVTNNGKGIASAGFNCSILPVKCSQDSGGMGIYRGYEGIVYAANIGAKIINCSWGGPGFSPAEQDIINYALNKGSLVVVAAGNDGANIDFGGQYPAGYDNVLCVGATNSSNRVASFSNWGMKVTIYAPGQSIYSTVPNNSYQSQSGTSMSSPLTAGVASLVASVHKDWSPKQILHQIRSTSDNVLATDQNQRPYYYGKINAYKAVLYNSGSNPGAPGLEIVGFRFTQGSAFNDYSSKVIELRIKNFLSPASNTILRIKPLNNFISLSQDVFNVGNITTNGESIVYLGAELLPNNPWYLGYVSLLCTFESGGYVDYQIINLPINIVSNNTLKTVATFPDQYQPIWFDASSPSMETLWAVGQGGLFGPSSGFVLVRSGSVTMNYIGQQPIYCIHAFSPTSAIVGSGSQNQTTAYVYKTTNSGTSWTQTNVSSITGFINALYFFDDLNGILLGDPKNNQWGIGITTDGGATWQPILGVPLPNSGETGFINCTFRKGDFLSFGTSSGRVFYSTNRGKNWAFGNIPNAVTVSYVTFVDSLNGIAIYTEQSASTPNAIRYLATTTDGGKMWKPRQYNFTQNGYTPVYVFSPENSNSIYLLCNGGEIFATSDLGATWIPILNEYTGRINIGSEIVWQKSNIRLWQLGSKISFLDFSFTPQNVVKQIRLTSGNTINFDTLTVGGNKLKSVSIINEGNVPVKIQAQIDTSAGSLTGEFKIFGSVADSIFPDEEIQMRIRFVPKVEGLRRATLIITSDANPSSIAVDLFGYGRIIAGFDEKIPISNDFEIIPNPTSGKFTIQLPDGINKIEKIVIYNVLGNEIYSIGQDIESKGSIISIDDISLPSGIYLVKIFSLFVNRSKLLIVQ
ncbi:MAG: S8 family serine peptidase [Candidatus Kapaibacteriales bacterium]